jgi:hypothetical protein
MRKMLTAEWLGPFYPVEQCYTPTAAQLLSAPGARLAFRGAWNRLRVRWVSLVIGGDVAPAHFWSCSA